MVQIINKSVCRGVAGKRTGKMKGVVIHNTWDNATAESHINRLASYNNTQLAKGFAHYFIDHNAIVRVEDTFNGAWHVANSDGNMNYLGFEIRGNRSTPRSEFLAAEQNTFKQAAEDLDFYGLPANRDTVRLHSEFSPTECPKRSLIEHIGWDSTQELPAAKRDQMKDYFIQEIRKYMKGGGGGTTPPTTGGNTSVDGASIPVKTDSNRSTAHLDEFRVSGDSLYTRGWHIGNYKYQYLIIIDANTNKEITRRLAKGVNRPDVNAMYKTSGDVGFSENFDLAQFKGRTVYLWARCTNNPKGEGDTSGFSDIDFKQWPISVPK